MQSIRAERTAVTPEVVFAPAEQRLFVQGECYPENPLPFFQPLLSTLRQYFAAERPACFAAEMRLQYVNSASTRGLRSLFTLLNDAGSHGTRVHVVWAHDAEDDVIEELGSDLAEDLPYVQLEHRPF